MDPDLWRRIEAAYFEATNLAPTEWASYLDASCPEPEVRAEVESLLRARAESSGFLDSHALGNTPWLSDVTIAEDSWEREMRPILDEEGVPEAIGDYHILAEIGRGGMGIVYLARDQALHRDVALKILPESHRQDTAAWTRFEREAELLGRLSHPNVAQVYSLEQTPVASYFTMELVHGSSLDELLAEAPLPYEQALSIAYQITTALEAAHSCGVLHCDLKPSNIRVTPDQQVKVVDFGLASGTGVHSPQVSGTAGYMSPERLSGEELDHQDDLWALGCVLYECFTGTPCFSGNTPRARMDATLAFQGLLDRPSLIPAPVQELVAHCLEPDKTSRVASATVVRQTLQKQLETKSEPHLTVAATAEPRDSFTGRSRELEEFLELLREPTQIRLFGEAGVGKTRLLHHVCQQLTEPHSTWRVDLSQIHTPQQIIPLIAAAFGISPTSRWEQVIEAIPPSQPGTLILDGCDHLEARCLELTGELQALCPTYSFVTVARAPGPEYLRHYELKGLPTPAAQADSVALEDSEACQLFRARMKSGLDESASTPQSQMAIGQIVRTLRGNPLAIELAAARVGSLTVEELAVRLEDRQRLLDSQPSENPLDPVIDWSYQQLTAPERQLLRQLSLFEGGWTDQIAVRVCEESGNDETTLPNLARLVDANLVQRDSSPAGAGDPANRYWMLESVRRFATSQLSATERAKVQARQLSYYLEATEELRLELLPDQEQAFRILDREYKNLLALLQFSADQEQLRSLRLELAIRMGRFWISRGFWWDGMALLDEYLKKLPADAPPIEFGHVHRILSALNFHAGNFEVAKKHADKSVEIALAINDETLDCYSRINLGLIVSNLGDQRGAREHFETGLTAARRVQSLAAEAYLLSNLAANISDTGELDRARELFTELLELLPHHNHGLALSAYQGLGTVSWRQGRIEVAKEQFQELLRVARELGDKRRIAMALGFLGIIAQDEEDFTAARILHHQGLAMKRELKDLQGITSSLTNLGIIAQLQGKLDEAEAFHHDALERRRSLGEPRAIATSLFELAMVARDRTAYDDAEALLRECLTIRRDLEDRTAIVLTLNLSATIDIGRERFEIGLQKLACAEALQESLQLALSKAEIKECQEYRARAESRLVPEVAEAAWAAGASQTWQEKVRETLDTN